MKKKLYTYDEVDVNGQTTCLVRLAREDEDYIDCWDSMEQMVKAIYRTASSTTTIYYSKELIIETFF